VVMVVPDGVTVYFACLHYDLVYQAQQARVLTTIAGQFNCTTCRKPVYSLTGKYGYFSGSLSRSEGEEQWQPTNKETAAGSQRR
jgi:hypothetical protein